MCSVTAGVMIALTVASAATSAYAAKQQADATTAANEYNAKVARNNQELADQAAADAIKRGKVEAQLKQQETAALKGRQLTALAANGVDVGSGSAVDVTSNTDALGKFEELRIRSNAQREALGFQTEGMNYAAKAGLESYSAQSAQAAGKTAVFSSLVGGASKVAGQWYNFKKT